MCISYRVTKHLNLLRTILDLGFPGGSVVKNPPAMKETQAQSQGQEIPWRREWLPTPAFFPEESHEWKQMVKNLPAMQQTWV